MMMIMSPGLLTRQPMRIIRVKITPVNQKALVVAATLRSWLFNALEWAKNGEKGKQKIYLLLL